MGLYSYTYSAGLVISTAGYLHLKNDEMVLASTVISTAERAKLHAIHPVEMETLATVAAFYVSAFSSSDTATVTLGMPLMNRPLGQSQVALTPMV